MAWSSPAGLDDYAHRIALVIAVTPAALTDFPVLVDLSDLDIPKEQILDLGLDFRFTEDDGTSLLTYEQEDYSEGASYAEGHFWVKVPYQDGVGNTTIYIYWGYASAGDGSGDPLDDGFGHVFHMNETSGSAMVDSVGTQNGVYAGDLPDGGRAGIVGGGQDFDGTGDKATVADNAIHDPGGAMTVECWVYHDANVAAVALVAHDTSSYVWMLYSTTGGVAAYVKTASGTTSTGATSVGTGSWKHVAFVYDKTLGSSRLKLFVDGSMVQSANGYNEDITSGDQGLEIGFWTNAAAYFNGIMDEVRYSTCTRPDAWLEFEYLNMSSADHQMTPGEIETQGGAAAGHPHMKRLGGVPFVNLQHSRAVQVW